MSEYAPINTHHTYIPGDVVHDYVEYNLKPKINMLENKIVALETTIKQYEIQLKPFYYPAQQIIIGYYIIILILTY